MNKKFKNFYGVIYITYNLINGKFYIGQTIYNNSDYLGSGKILKNAFKKYGKVNFKKKILCICYSKKELNFAEMYLIKKFQACKFGYNITKGGSGGDTFSNNPNKEEIRTKFSKSSSGRIYKKERNLKISIHRLGMIFTDEHRKNLSISHKGQESNMKGKHHSEEAKNKMSKNHNSPGHTGRCHSPESKIRCGNGNRGRKQTQEEIQKRAFAQTIFKFKEDFIKLIDLYYDYKSIKEIACEFKVNTCTIYKNLKKLEIPLFKHTQLNTKKEWINTHSKEQFYAKI